VEAQKKGRWIFCSVPNEPDAYARRSIEWLRDVLQKNSMIIEDARRLKIILKEDPKDICRRQLGKSKSYSFAPATPAGARWPKGGRAGSKAR
jgi:hypothetical protein